MREPTIHDTEILDVARGTADPETRRRVEAALREDPDLEQRLAFWSETARALEPQREAARALNRRIVQRTIQGLRSGTRRPAIEPPSILDLARSWWAAPRAIPALAGLVAVTLTIVIALAVYERGVPGPQATPIAPEIAQAPASVADAPVALLSAAPAESDAPRDDLAQMIASAPSGGQILLRPGAFPRKITIRKAIRLEAEDGPVRIGGG